MPEGRYLDLPGRGRTWIREAPGPDGARAVLLLHGLGATGGLNWAGAHHFLGDRYGVVMVDHRGHGRGIRTDRFTLEDCADDAAAVIEELGMDRPIVAGYSMGGPIASLLWRRHPHLVGGLVLCATSRNFSGWSGEKLTFGSLALAGLSPVALPSSLGRAFAAAVHAVPLPGPPTARYGQWALEEISRHDPRSVVQAGAALGGFDSSGWIHRVDVPSAVVVTTADQLVPPTRQLRLAASLPGARVRRVQLGHLCIAGDSQRARFLAALRNACIDVDR